MNKLLSIFAATRPLAAALLLASLAVLVFVYISQYVFHYDPCPLCLWQRKPYFAVVALSLLALGFSPAKPCAARWLLGLCGLAFVTGAGIAFFHTGVEQGWWKGLESCADSGMPPAGDIAALREYLTNRKIVDCGVPTWKFLGLSMTAYNLMTSVVLAAFTFVMLRRGRGAACKAR